MSGLDLWSEKWLQHVRCKNPFLKGRMQNAGEWNHLSWNKQDHAYSFSVFQRTHVLAMSKLDAITGHRRPAHIPHQRALFGILKHVLLFHNLQQWFFCHNLAYDSLLLCHAVILCSKSAKENFSEKKRDSSDEMFLRNNYEALLQFMVILVLFLTHSIQVKFNYIRAVSGS